MSPTHAAVWLDHHEAHVFEVDPVTFNVSTVEAARHVPRHPRSEARPRNHPDDAPRFFRDIVTALAGATQVLVVGPSTAKIHFADFVREHARQLHVVGVETVDHPTANQIAAYVRQYFAVPGASQGDMGE
jgi:stalled ribosome rescue protein Dom34